MIILSFVVQNYNSSPFLIKTQRYNKLVTASSVNIIFIFTKLLIHSSTKSSGFKTYLPHLLYLTNFFYQNSFFKLFKSLYTKQFGIMTSNLTKSLQFKAINDLYCWFDNKTLSKSCTSLLNLNSTLGTKYLQPVTIVSFAFHKTTYNTLMIYIFFLLTNSYNPSQNSFRLYYSFVIHNQNLALYPFLNLFYFKIRQF